MLFFIGLTFETVADIQLRRFLRDPSHHNQIMRSGLWRYSRHSNYFGEFLVWCGSFLIALETPWGWLATVSPLTLADILLGPPGIGLVVRRMRKKRPEAFADDERVTSAFIPWPRTKPGGAPFTDPLALEREDAGVGQHHATPFIGHEVVDSLQEHPVAVGGCLDYAPLDVVQLGRELGCELAHRRLPPGWERRHWPA